MVHQISWASDTNGEKEMDRKVWLRKYGGKRSLGRLTCTWCGNKETGLLLLLISGHVDDEEEGRALTRGLPSTVTQRFIHAHRLVWP